jgi:uncharacterized low-complexity protein
MKKTSFLAAGAVALVSTVGCASAKTAEKVATADATKVAAEHKCGAAMGKDGCCGATMDKSPAGCCGASHKDGAEGSCGEGSCGDSTKHMTPAPAAPK